MTDLHVTVTSYQGAFNVLAESVLESCLNYSLKYIQMFWFFFFMCVCVKFFNPYLFNKKVYYCIDQFVGHAANISHTVRRIVSSAFMLCLWISFCCKMSIFLNWKWMRRKPPSCKKSPLKWIYSVLYLISFIICVPAVENFLQSKSGTSKDKIPLRRKSPSSQLIERGQIWSSWISSFRYSRRMTVCYLCLSLCCICF